MEMPQNSQLAEGVAPPTPPQKRTYRTRKDQAIPNPVEIRADLNAEINDPKPADGPAPISREDYDVLMARLAKLENPGIPVRVKRVKDHTAVMRMWQDGLVVRVGSMRENYLVPESDPNRCQLELTVLALDGTQQDIKVPYLHFLENSDKVLVDIIKQDIHERTEVDPRRGGGGIGNRLMINREGMSTDVPTGEEIELAVTFQDIKCVVRPQHGPFVGIEVPLGVEQQRALNV